MEPYLAFERPIDHAETTLKRLAWRIRHGATAETVGAYLRAAAERDELRHRLYGERTPWQHVQLARHPRRPHGLRAAGTLFGELAPLRGDRLVGDDPAIVTGIGRWRERAVMVVACERGDGKADARRRNFGMPGPAGFRKVIRALDLAEERGLPVVSLVDTPGAYPGLDSERYCVAAAISQTLARQASVRAPTLGVVLGEGGSGGALAMAMGDRVLMLEYAYFSVISPEACASILWRDGARTPAAAAALRLMPADLHGLRIVDEVVPEPPGGAHRYPVEALCLLREAVDRHLGELLAAPLDDLRAARMRRYRAFGHVERTAA